ncbi:MAG: hypothetical protein P4L53_20835 [Candidatus Obscuribacterales bacterium]|nr:hypothetical protein [Candidatus Obscuribacterales bacterium]
MTIWGQGKEVIDTFQQAVLGTIALRKNDIQTASNYLLDIKSGDQVEQPMFQLAQEMLACVRTAFSGS